MTVRPINNNDFSIVELLEQFKGGCLNISTNQFQHFVSTLHNDHIILVIEDQQKIISCGTILIETKILHNLGKVGHIEDIIIKKEYRKKGLGKLLINNLVQVCKDRKCYKILLDCSIELINFYEKCGFKNNGNQMTIYL